MPVAGAPLAHRVAGLAALTLLATGLTVSASEAAPTISVRSDGSPCTSAVPVCPTVQRAVALAAVGFPGQDVTVAIGPGEFAGATIALPATESTLTFVGAGIGRTVITPVGAAGAQVGFDIGDGVTVPVAIENLTITAGAPAPGGASSRTGDGAAGQDQIGIGSRHPGPLTVRNVGITQLHGGNGGRGAEFGGDGGSALGIVHANSDLAATTIVDNVRVDSLTGGSGAPGDALGGYGGTAAGVMQRGGAALSITNSRISDLRGGQGAPGIPGRVPGGEGGSAFGIATDASDGTTGSNVVTVHNSAVKRVSGEEAAAVFSAGTTVRFAGSTFDNPDASDGTCLVADDGRIVDDGYNDLPARDDDCPPASTTRIGTRRA